MTRKRVWTGQDVHINRSSLANEMEGLSPLTIFDMNADAVVFFKDKITLRLSTCFVKIPFIYLLITNSFNTYLMLELRVIVMVNNFHNMRDEENCAD